jgi:DNA-binding winged helix-turn-helix (wHTH) protein
LPKFGGRAFDVLMALIQARGAVVSKEALMARVWPGRITEENSLAAQIVALRAALGPERALIRTVSGRGYQFTGEIRILSVNPDKAEAGMATAEHASVVPPTNTPKPVSELRRGWRRQSRQPRPELARQGVRRFSTATSFRAGLYFGTG